MIALLCSVSLLSVALKPLVSPWSLVPRDALEIRQANLRDGVEYNDKWIRAYMNGEKNFGSYFKDLVHPYDRYQPELDKLIKDKRGMSPGFAGIDNELFINPNTIMVFGNAKTTMSKLSAAMDSV